MPDPTLDAFLDFSPVSRASLDAFPEWREWVLAQAKIGHGERSLSKIKIEWGEWKPRGGDGRAAMEMLRRFKRREMLRIGFRDWCEASAVQESLTELSRLASFCIEITADLSWKEAVSKRGDPGTPFLVLGMGKLGGGELNYSSDVDLVLVYGEEGDATPRMTRHEWFQQWGRHFVSSFAERTGEGSLFRIDMRLRPDGDAGPLVRSLDGCENYFAAFGETWERLAYMKAKRVSGDEELAYEFGLRVQPFCYPKMIPPELLAEVSHVKKRIETELLDGITRETDVKRGIGGIREIEFIVQVQQLLHGGCHPYLQERSTLKAMTMLEQSPFMKKETVEALREAYFFWRRIEHRIQMVEEAQTHEIPENYDARWKIAQSLGFGSLAEFEEACRQRRQTVRHHFDELIREAPTSPQQSPRERDLMWANLSPSGFRVLENLRSGPAFANISPRTKELFARLEPLLAKEMVALVSPEDVMVGLERFVERYGSRGHLYETWLGSPKALQLLLKLFDASVLFRDLLVAHPDWLEEICREEEIDVCRDAKTYWESALNIETVEKLRLWRWEEGLRIAIQDVLGLITNEQREEQHSHLADACVRRIAGWTNADELCVLAAGKWGGRELGYGSDLDMVFVGGCQTHASSIIKTLSERTASGHFFSADARLRPEGDKGILTPSPDAVVSYYESRAQTWEFLALAKYRKVCGLDEIWKPIQQQLLSLWKERGKRWQTWPEVIAMRAMVEKERGKGQPVWSQIKTGSGGIMDVEFAAQSWQMGRGFWEPSTRRALDAMSEEFPIEAKSLLDGYEVLRRVESLMRRWDFASRNSLPSDGDEQCRLALRYGLKWGEMLAELDSVRQSVRASYHSVMRSLQH